MGIDTPPSESLHGGLLVDKPSGPTSQDIVGFTRRLLKTKRVGHTGTLDPLASGLLVLLVGHATRLAQFLVSDVKEYIADIRLGVATRTYDAASLDETAVRWAMADGRWPMGAELESALERFRGSFLQTPPPFSAKKIEGKRAYEMARRDEAVALEPVPVTVRELQLLDPSAIDHRPSTIESQRDATLVRVRVAASSGFYVRSLAHDLGQVLGCGGHLEALRRTRAGRFRVDDAATLEVLERMGSAASERLIPMNALLVDYPAVSLTSEGLRRACNGNSLSPRHLAQLSGQPAVGSDARVRVLAPDGELLSVAAWRPDGLLHPLLVLR